MPKKHPGKNYTMYNRDTHYSNNGDQQVTNTEVNRTTETGNNFVDMTEYSTIYRRENSESYIGDRLQDYVQRRRLESGNVEYSIDELLTSTNYTDEFNTNDVYSYSVFRPSEERVDLQDKYEDSYHEDFPVKEMKFLLPLEGKYNVADESLTASERTPPSDFKLPCEEYIQYKKKKHITPAKYKQTRDNNEVNYLENFPFNPAMDYQSENPYLRHDGTIPMDNVSHKSLNAPYDGQEEIYVTSHQCQSIDSLHDSLPQCEEECIHVNEPFYKRWFSDWITSLMASTHFPSKYLAAMIRDFIIYLFFIICLLIVVLFTADSVLYYYCRSINEFIINEPFKIEGPASFKTYRSMNSVTDVWSFITDSLVPNVYISQIKDGTIESSSAGTDLSGSILIGVPRLRQVRVKPDRCLVQPEFKNVFSACYDYFSSLTEDRDSFGLKSKQSWTYLKDSNDMTYFGKISNYCSGGFNYNFSKEEDKSKEELNALKDGTWIDRATRAVFIDFTLYSPNINYFHIVKLAMEFPPSGGVLPHSHCYTLRLIRYTTFYDYFVLGCEIFLVFFVIYYTAKLLRELSFYGRTYCLLFWGVYDFLLLLIAFMNSLLWLITTLISYKETTYLIEMSMKNDTFFPNFDYVKQLHMIYIVTSVIFLSMALFKLFYFLMIFKSYCYFSSTLTECALQLICHLVLVVIVLLFFAIVGHLLFGTQVEDFSSVGWSFFTLFIMILGSFNVDKLFAANFIMAPVFIYLFVIIVLFIFVNFFISIIIHAYSSAQCKENQSNRLYLGEALADYMKKKSLKRCVVCSKHDSQPYKEIERKCNCTLDCYVCHVDPFIISDPKTEKSNRDGRFHSKLTHLDCEKSNGKEMKLVRGEIIHDSSGQEILNDKKNNVQLTQIKDKIECLDKTVDQIMGKVNLILKKMIEE